MSASKPLWLRGVQAADRIAGPVLEAAVRHEHFGFGLSLLHQTKRAVYRRTERGSRRILHGLNLPTASDVNRLLAQIVAVENRVRALSAHVEQHIPISTEPLAVASDSGESSHDDD